VSICKYCLNGGLQFTTGGSQISIVNDYVHLGHHMCANLDHKSDILSRSTTLCGKINNMLCQFSNCDSFVKLRLLHNFCCNFYSCTLWDLAHSSINDLCIAWHKGLRRIWGFPYQTHSVLLAPLCDMLPLEFRLRNDLYCVGWGVELYSLTHCPWSMNYCIGLVFLYESVWTMKTKLLAV